MKDRGSRAWAAAVLAAVVALFAVAAGAAPSLARPNQEQPVRLGDRIAPERAEVNLVLVDVLVTGRGGRPARGLKQGDFELLIDRLPAPISSFEDYCLAPPPGPPGTVEEAPPPERSVQPRHIILFFDISHLTRAGRDRSLDAALKYVREGMTDGDRVMLIAMKGAPILLEPFTSDRAALASRLEAVRADNDMIDLTVLEEKLNSLDILSRDCGPLDGRCQHRLNVAMPYALAEEARARRTLNAILNMMPALAAIQGRKTLVLFAETLRDEPGLQYLILAGSTAKREGIDIKPLVQELHRAANAASVSLYPVFAAGLGEGSGTGQADASFTVATADAAVVQRATLAGEDAALGLNATLAAETGGQPLQRSNDLAKVFTSVEADLSCYYVLGYLNPGPGDGKRHSIIVKTKARGYDLRHRPYFEDWSDDEKLDRKFRSALMAPAYFREIPVSVEAYALTPGEKETQILVKIQFPLNEVTLVGQPDRRRAGEVEVRGTVWTDSKQTLQFERRIPLSLDPGDEPRGRSVIYETGCELPPGSHNLTVALLDSGSWEIGAAEVPVPVRARTSGIAGDVVLWTSSAGDILVAADAASVGIRDSGTGHGFVPRAERRFGLRETGLLYVIVCPPLESEVEAGLAAAAAAGGDARMADPIEVRRTLYVEEQAVATFPVVTLRAGGAAAPGKEPGTCEGIFTTITPGQLGPGGYTYEVRVTGIGPEPIVRRAGFAVEETPTAEPGS